MKYEILENASGVNNLTLAALIVEYNHLIISIVAAKRSIVVRVTAVTEENANDYMHFIKALLLLNK